MTRVDDDLPTVSVIIIFLDAAAFLEEAIDSVRTQSRDDWELLLVDDGSIDSSRDIAHRFAARDRRARVLFHEGGANRGMSASRNLGILHARGEYVAFLDADDMWLPRKLEEQAQILAAHPGAAMVYGQTLRWFSWDGSREGPGDHLADLGVPLDSILEPPTLVIRNLEAPRRSPSMSSAMFRRPVLEKVGGFDEEFRGIFEDQVICSKIALHHPVYVSSHCWDHYRQHEQNSLARGIRSGTYHYATPNEARRKYLEWLEGYIAEHGPRDAELARMLNRRLHPYRYPRLALMSASVAKARDAFWRPSTQVAVAKTTLRGLANRILSHRRASITASPNPILEAAGGLGATELRWNADVAEVEVRVDRPDGNLLSRSASSGTAKTGKWVHDRMRFYLQDVSNGRALTSENTLATVQVRVRSIHDSFPLAVCAPTVGAPSESFIRRNMEQLLPGRTVVVTGTTHGPHGNFWSFEGPLLVSSNSHRFDPGARSVRQFLRRHGVLVVLAHYLDESLPLLDVASDLNLRFFVHAHGYDVSRLLLEKHWRHEYLRYARADGIVTVSSASRARLIELGLPPGKIVVIPCGVDVPEEPLRRGHDRSIRCLAVGRMVSKKGPVLLLDGFRRAAEIVPELRLDFVGTGALYPAARQYVRAFHLDDRVTFYGAQPAAVVQHLMSRADMFLQHSVTDPETGDEEGLPVSILEAMAAALPVVSTRHAGIPEAVEDEVSGFLVGEGDCKAMGERIVLLARDANARQRLGEAGWEAARTRFSAERERAALLELMGLSHEP